jgi:DNA polymerase-1
MPQTLYIIDGHAQIFSAYFAPMTGNLTSPSGEPTKATYIFTTMLFKLLKESKPDMLVVTLDAPGATFRNELYDQYKANRPPIPEDLPVQINRIAAVLQAMNIPTFSMEGYEADDLIGTLVKKGAEKGFQIYICSKDKDLEQLIGPQVAMLSLKNGDVTDEAALLEKKGIRPNQVIDVLSLSGDTVDNIPGVPGVGPGIAAQWIQKYESLDNLLAHADEIKGKRGDSLRDSMDVLDLSKKLVTLDCDVPLEIQWDDLGVKPIDEPAVIGVFQELGFQKLLGQLGLDSDGRPGPGQGGGGEKNDHTSLKCHLVDTPEKFDSFYRKLQKQECFAIDTETTSLNPIDAELVGISISWKAGEGYYLPVKVPLGQPHLDVDLLQSKLGPLLSDPAIGKSGQNIKYDLNILRCADLPLTGVAFDTMIASFVLDSHRLRHGLDSLALDHLNYETIHLEELLGKGKKRITFDMVEPHMATDYAAEDAEVTWRLTEFYQERMTDGPLKTLYEEVEMPLLEVLAEMEFHGIALNVPWLKKLNVSMTDQMEKLVADIHKEAGRVFNVDSPKQLGEVLFNELALAPVKKGKTGPSTDQEVLETLAGQHPVPALMLEYRQLSKLKNTYVDKLPKMISPKTGRVHGSFNQTIAATGRLSSSDPNLQNIPIRSEQGQEIRRAFVAEKGNVLLAADYSQVELRLLAHFSKDEGLLEAFQSGQDIHRFVASQVNDIDPEEVDVEQRSKAKAVNFGIIYGQTAFGLSRSINISVDQAKKFIESYFARYPRIRQFMDDALTKARGDGHVTTILGRRRDLPDLTSGVVAQQRLAERMAVNTIIQGSAADLIKVAMINIHRRIKNEGLAMKMILQVHDELVFELPETDVAACEEMVRSEMTGAIDLDVPITVDTGHGPNWLDCK